MTRTRWDYRLEPADGVNLRTGAAIEGTRVKFRKAGSRGRFDAFVVMDPWPTCGTVALIDRYLDAKAAKKRLVRS